MRSIAAVRSSISPATNPEDLGSDSAVNVIVLFSLFSLCVCACVLAHMRVCLCQRIQCSYSRLAGTTNRALASPFCFCGLCCRVTTRTSAHSCYNGKPDPACSLRVATFAVLRTVCTSVHTQRAHVDGKYLIHGNEAKGKCAGDACGGQIRSVKQAALCTDQYLNIHKNLLRRHQEVKQSAAGG